VLASVDGLVPVRHRAVVREVACEIDRAMGGLLRGFGTVCLTLGTFYALALTATGLDFGLLIGLFSGAISFIPFVGATVGFLLSMGVAVSQFWAEPVWIAAVAAIFMLGQAVESNILTPRLVGDAVDVHPLWLLFALAAFGAVFGFVGLLVAVPAAAVIGVLVRRGVARYKQSRFYATDGQEGGR
jgi:predicted PurR-regulated permease PerM